MALIRRPTRPDTVLLWAQGFLHRCLPLLPAEDVTPKREDNLKIFPHIIQHLHNILSHQGGISSPNPNFTPKGEDNLNLSPHMIQHFHHIQSMPID